MLKESPSSKSSGSQMA